jgi:hypothetical protein
MDINTAKETYYKASIDATAKALMDRHYAELMRNQDSAGSQYANAYGTPAIPQTTNSYKASPLLNKKGEVDPQALKDFFAGHFGGGNSLDDQHNQVLGMGGAALAATGGAGGLLSFIVKKLSNPNIKPPGNIDDITKGGQDFADKNLPTPPGAGANQNTAQPPRIMDRVGETNTVSKIMQQLIGHLPPLSGR